LLENEFIKTLIGLRVRFALATIRP